MGAENFGKNPLYEAEWREGISLEMIPRLDHRVHRCHLGIRHRRNVNLEAMVKRGGEQDHRHQPTPEKLQADIHTEGPLGAEDLGTAAERVSKDVEAPRDKLGEQTHSTGLAQAKDFLSHRVEGRGVLASLLAEVRKSRGIVCEQRHGWLDRPLESLSG